MVNIFLVDTGMQEQKTFKGEVPLYYQKNLDPFMKRGN